MEGLDKNGRHTAYVKAAALDTESDTSGTGRDDHGQDRGSEQNPDDHHRQLLSSSIMTTAASAPILGESHDNRGTLLLTTTSMAGAGVAAAALPAVGTGEVCKAKAPSKVRSHAHLLTSRIYLAAGIGTMRSRLI